jgi:hypothetical protein
VELAFDQLQRRVSQRISPTVALALIVVAGEWTGLARAVVGAPLYAGLLDVLLVGLVVGVGLRAFRAGRVVGSLPLYLVAAYMLLAALEVLNPNVPSFAVGLEGYRKTAFTMLGFFVVLWSHPADFGRFYRLVAVGSLPAFLWASRQFFAPLPVEQDLIAGSGVSSVTFHSGSVLRAFAPTAGPFHLGILAACALVIGIILAHRGSRWWLVVAILGAWTLGLSLTRANMIAGAVGAATVVVFAGALREQVRAAAAAALPILTIAFAGLVAIGTLALPAATASPQSAVATPSPAATHVATPAPTPSRPAISDVVSGVTDALEDKNLQLRFGYWRHYVSAIAQRPLLGYGTSAAADGMKRLYDNTGSVRFEPHSMYLKAPLELGVVGLAVLLALLVWAYREAFLQLSAQREAALVALGLLVVLSVSGITGPMLDAYPFNLLFWSSCGWLAFVGHSRSTSTDH